MTPAAQRIVEEASQLPDDDLDWVIECLLIQQKKQPDAEVEAAWDAEIKRRLDEIDSGAVEMVPGDQVRAKMMARLGKQ